MGIRSRSEHQEPKRATDKKRLLLAVLGVLGTVSITVNIWLVSAGLFESKRNKGRHANSIAKDPEPKPDSISISDALPGQNSKLMDDSPSPRPPISRQDRAVISSELVIDTDNNTLVFPLPTVIVKPDFDATPTARENVKGPDLELLSTSQGSRASQTLWLSRMGAHLPVCAPVKSAAANACPEIIPRTYQNQPLVRGQLSRKDAYFFYGPEASTTRFLVVMDRDLKHIRGAFDFGSFLIGPQTKPGAEDLITQNLLWAACENNTLYIANAHSSYSENSGGRNAYLTAIDLRTRKIRWRSAPRVANASTFEIIGDTIVSGHGFTKEPDYLYMIDKATGGVVNRILLKTGPEVVLRGSGQKLLVTTYDTNYVFKIRQ